MRGIERQELAKFIAAQQEVFGPALGEERVAERQLCLGAIGALRIVVDDVAVFLTGLEPLLVCRRLLAALEQELVGIGRPRRNRFGFLSTSTDECDHRDDERNPCNSYNPKS